MSLHTVLGATGAQGGAVVTALLELGETVRAVTRHASSARAQALSAAGVEVVEADLLDQAALRAAFADTDTVFAVTTPFESGPQAEIDQGMSILAASVDVAHLVFSSVSDADRRTGVPHFDSKAVVESALRESGRPHTIIGPTYFYDNIVGSLDEIRETGLLELPIPTTTPLQQLSRRDLGRFAAAVLTDPSVFDGLRIDIASDNPTPDEMAATLGAVLDREVTAVATDPAELGSDDMRAMFTYLGGHGYSADINNLHATHPGIGWQTFGDWLDGVISTR
ncbi:NmrA/HSCARG family protein [Williamsia phyllosphaerae]|uniref:NmrA-like domain-containing protein n=1 Tax=Williamsia phyllosphaerae TaxID=885042 RepID=A0ABQ1UIQ1_9NOCA|nr:NmrA/HSCARG family protein [Williamsia phyllosphaerae]GGF19603.1 hypothetical protein GCM10007298_14570 [Williamsia phyllosphaerae]